MSQPRRVLIIGGKSKLLKRSKDLGLEVIYVQKKELFRTAFLPYVDQVFLMDYENLDVLLPLARTLHEVLPFGYVTSVTEPGLIPAAAVNDALGLPGNSLETASLLKDKWAMRQRLNDLGLSLVAARLGRTEQDLTAFVRDYGLPIFIKPVDSTGSYGVLSVRQTADLALAGQHIRELGLTSFVIEEYLEGPEVSVESCSFDGQHVIMAITDKYILPNCVEIGHSVPAQLTDDLEKEVCDLVTAFLDAVGLKDGPAHTELKLTPHGPRIVESHNRVGGDKISDLVEIAYGVDMAYLTLAWAFGEIAAPGRPVAPQAGAAVRFFAPPPGIVREISGVQEVQDREEVVEIKVYVEVGDRVPPVRQSEDRSGHITVKGKDVQHAIKACEQLAQKIRIVTT
jgi:biotin carboxylase